MTAVWIRTDEERDALFRKAREDSQRIGGANYNRRQKAKESLEEEKQKHYDHLCSSYRKRDQRWKSRLAGNPLAVDQLAATAAREKTILRREQTEAQAREYQLLAAKEREDQTARRAMKPGRDEELLELRQEKKHLQDVDQQLRALHVLERSERTVKPIRCVKYLHRTFFTDRLPYKFNAPPSTTPKRSASLPALGPPPWRQHTRTPGSGGDGTQAPSDDMSMSAPQRFSEPMDDGLFLPAGELTTHDESFLEELGS